MVRCMQVDTLSTSELLEGRWIQHAAVLVMPGGADLPYCKHLNGKGNLIIKGKHSRTAADAVQPAQLCKPGVRVRCVWVVAILPLAKRHAMQLMLCISRIVGYKQQAIPNIGLKSCTTSRAASHLPAACCCTADFVHSGGSYLGLCAGAYFGCSRVVFEPGTPLEVVGDRELAFFPGIARGAAFPGTSLHIVLHFGQHPNCIDIACAVK